MILVDTSVWIDHLRRSNPMLQERLRAFQVLCHPMVVGELACGRIAQRRQVLTALSDLPRTHEASHAEVLMLIEGHGLAGAGLGYVDAHLVASVLITPGASLWTHDRAPNRIARKLGIDVPA